VTIVHPDVCTAGRITVASFAIRNPKTTSPTASVQDMWDLFRDDHVHMALLTDGDHLVGCVTRGDLAGAPVSAPAVSVASIHGRTVGAAQPIAAAWKILKQAGARRLAVIDEDDRLVGLLCLKHSRAGFCTDVDLEARAREHGTPPASLGASTDDGSLTGQPKRVSSPAGTA